MKNKYVCEICGNDAEHYEDWMGSTLMEDCDECRICGSVNEFITGGYKVVVCGLFEWTWNYETNDNHVKTIEGQIRIAKELCQVNLNETLLLVRQLRKNNIDPMRLT